MNWLKFKCAPFHGYFLNIRKVVSKNKNQFIFSAISRHGLTVETFHTPTNEWSSNIYTFDLEIPLYNKNHSIIINDKENKIYLCTPHHAIIIINTITKQYQVYELDKHCFGLGETPRTVSSTKVNGIIHLIVSTETKTKHIIFNEENGTFSEMFDFTQYQTHNEKLVSPIIIYPSTKKILLLTFSSKYNKHLHGLWIFKLETNKWNKIHSLIFPPSSQFLIPSATITANQQFVIFHCLTSGDDKIYVLDIRGNVIDYTLTECINKKKILPTTGIVTTGGGKNDELLIFGWIRNLFSKLSFNDVIFPPSYIIKFIMKWYSIELIHFIHDPGPFKNFHTHYAVNVKHILFYANIKTLN